MTRPWIAETIGLGERPRSTGVSVQRLRLIAGGKRALFISETHAFALEAAGESMADAGIQPGDQLLMVPGVQPAALVH